MILSDAGIRRAVTEGDISIDPAPEPGQLQTSAVDIFLGDSSRTWDLAKLETPGLKPVLDLADQRRHDVEIVRERSANPLNRSQLLRRNLDGVVVILVGNCLSVPLSNRMIALHQGYVVNVFVSGAF